MGMINVTKQGSEAFIDNERIDDLDFTTGLREYHPPRQARVDWRVIVASVGAATVAFVLLWIVYGVWKTIYCWKQNYVTCQALNTFEPFVFGSVFVLAIAGVAWFAASRIIAYSRQTRVIANRTNLVLDRFGDQQPADLFHGINKVDIVTMLMQRYQIANELERSIAPYKIYRSVNSLSLNSTTNATPLLEAPADDPSITPVPASEWLQWINRQPHVILAGATGKGKTVTAKPIIAPRIEAGEQLLILDPHADYWFGLQVFGGGENWEEISDAIAAVCAEYKARQDAREIYRRSKHGSMPVAAFKRLTVVLDEAFLTCLHLNTAPKGKATPWESFAEVLGSGARKVNISVIMLTQTANVEDIEISGPLRENFTRIAVDARSIKLMIAREETVPERKQQLYEALIGLQYPATTVVETSVELLDRTGFDQLPDPHVSAANNWDFVRSLRGSNNENGTSRTNARNIIDELRALRLSGVTRDEARKEYGLIFTDSDWTLAQ